MIPSHRHNIRHYVNTVTCVILVYTVYAQTASQAPRYTPEVTAVWRAWETVDTLNNAQWSAYALDCRTGEVLLDYHSGLSLAPASGLKTIPVGAALHYLGAEYRFKTRLYTSGRVDGRGVLDGDVIIVGGGDPTLGSDKVPGSQSLDLLMSSWVAAVQKAGIRHIMGSVVADNSLLEEQAVPDYWPWTDIGNYYGAGTSSLCIHDNLYHLFFRPGNRPGETAVVLRTVPEIPGLSFTNYMRTGPPGSGDNGYIFCAPRQYEAVLRGTIPAGGEEFSIKGSIPDPARFAAQMLTESLQLAGITVDGPPGVAYENRMKDGGQVLHETVSPPLKEIVPVVQQLSVNLYTEQLLKTIALVRTGTGSTANGIAVLATWLDSLGVPTRGLSLVDGSGLSRQNLVTTQLMGTYLNRMSRHPVFPVFYESFSIAGDPDDPGYVKKVGRGTAVAMNARIKTGYISAVRSFSGYVHTRSGDPVAYSLICNNYLVRTPVIDRYFETLLNHLASRP